MVPNMFVWFISEANEKKTHEKTYEIPTNILRFYFKELVKT